MAHGATATKGVTEELLSRFVAEVQRSRFRIAKPRLLTRLLVDELERARLRGTEYRPPADVATAATQVAEKITREAAM